MRGFALGQFIASVAHKRSMRQLRTIAGSIFFTVFMTVYVIAEPAAHHTDFIAADVVFLTLWCMNTIIL